MLNNIDESGQKTRGDDGHDHRMTGTPPAVGSYDPEGADYPALVEVFHRLLQQACKAHLAGCG